MAVEVVGREVEEDRALGREGDAVLELEAGGLADDGRVGVDLAGQRGERRADVAGHRDRLAGGPVDVPEQLDGGRLAVGPGHRDEAVRNRPPGQLQLPDHVDPALQSRRDHRRLPGNPGALDDRPHPIEKCQSIRIQNDFDADPRKPCRPIGMPGIDPRHRLPRARPAAAPPPAPTAPARRPETAPRAAAGETSWAAAHSCHIFEPAGPCERSWRRSRGSPSSIRCGRSSAVALRASGVRSQLERAPTGPAPSSSQRRVGVRIGEQLAPSRSARPAQDKPTRSVSQPHWRCLGRRLRSTAREVVDLTVASHSIWKETASSNLDTEGPH